MKKIVLLITLLAMTASIAACGKKEQSSALVGDGAKSTAQDEAVIGGADKATDISVTDEKKEDKKAEKKEDKKEDKASNVSSGDTVEEEKVTPTFMFFVTKKDADYEKAMKAVDELKKEYKNKVNFDIVDIDEKPEAKENFAMVVDNTPFLIMLDTYNNPCAFSPKLAEKSEMKATIESAMQ